MQHSILPFDASFLSNTNLLLALLQLKKTSGYLREDATWDAILQTICYSIGPLAYSRSSVFEWNRSKPLVSLLIFPSCIYRLSFTKPENPYLNPFGLHLEIEQTRDLNLMGWILKTYIEQFKADYFHLLSSSVEPKRPDICSWSPVNFDFGAGSPALSASNSPSFGFLFRTTSATLKKVSLLNVKYSCAPIPEDKCLIVKYLSTLLEAPCYVDGVIGVI